jgi:hypothetical protein
MKTRIFQILGVAAIATIGLASCETDACQDVDCGTNGTCVEGDCVCDAGYEGTNCDTEERADFLGNYLLNETCPSGSIVDYAVTINPSGSDVTKILINGFGGFQCGGSNIVVEATVDGDNLTIANQEFCQGQITITSGNGTINSAGLVINLTYSADYGVVETCTATYTKQ